MTQGELCLNKTQFENFTTIGQGLIRNEFKCCKSRVKQCQLLSREVKQFATLSLQFYKLELVSHYAGPRQFYFDN